MSWWVGAYIEAGMGVSGGATPYLPFVFQDSTKAQAEKDAAAKLLSGPYSTQAAAQAWADAYEKNPKTTHAGSDIPSGPGNPFHGAGTGPGGTGTVKGDTPPNPLGALGNVFSLSASAGFLTRLAEGILGIILIAVGLSRLTRAVPIANKIAGAVT